MLISNGTIIAFSVVGGVGTFSSSVYYTIRAYRNKTGPTISPGKHMRDYSGHFEMDMLPAFVNLVTALQYLGETMETIENRFGFFSQYRYGSYMITCPLMVYELIHTIGAPYATTLFALTLFTIMTALFADCSPEPSSRWAWFTIGCLLNTLFCVMMSKVVAHAHKLNEGMCSDKAAMENVKRLGYDAENFPKGILRLKTPMDEKKGYIDVAFGLMFFLWPIFPLMFCLEYTGCVDKSVTQVVFAVTDLVIKTAHSFCLDQYKDGLRQTVFSYGFLDNSVLYELNIWDDSHDIYSQLKGLSRAMYGDMLVGNKGQLSDVSKTNLDYNSMLIANRVNRKVDSYTDYESFKEEESRPVSRTISPKAQGSSLRRLSISSHDLSRVVPEPQLNILGTPPSTQRDIHFTPPSASRELRFAPQPPIYEPSASREYRSNLQQLQYQPSYSREYSNMPQQQQPIQYQQQQTQPIQPQQPMQYQQQQPQQQTQPIQPMQSRHKIVPSHDINTKVEISQQEQGFVWH